MTEINTIKISEHTTITFYLLDVPDEITEVDFAFVSVPSRELIGVKVNDGSVPLFQLKGAQASVVPVGA